MERADALRFESFDDELIFAARFIHFEIAAGEDLHAVLRFEFYETGVAFEEGALELALGVFKREVEVAAGGRAAVGDFAFDPDGAEFVFERATGRRR